MRPHCPPLSKIFWTALQEVAMFDARQIHPLTDFLRNHKGRLAELKEIRMPEV